MRQAADRRLKKFVPFKDIILFEDEDILVVNKPLYMASLHDKDMRNLQGMAQAYHADLKLCHRLDKMTSGVLIMAKGDENYRSISLQFQRRQIKKLYKTLVAGIHHYDNYLIDKPLLVSTNKKVSINRDGKKSQTIINTERHFLNFSLLQCEPVTGRMHQIRAHLASLDCPIVGDALYGGKDFFLSKIKRKYKSSARKEEQAVNHGYLLHAESVTFTHPRSDKEISCTAPYPKNFSVVLKVLEKYNS